MVQLSEERLVEIAEAVAAGQLAISRAAIQCGVGRRTLFNWLQQSQAGDERYLIRWPGDDLVPFHRALNMARKMAILEARGEGEARALRGWDEVATFQGQVVWQLDPRAVGLSREVRELLGYDPDGYLRNERNECIPVIIRRHCSDKLWIKVMESHFEEYRTTTNVNQTLSGNLQVGVTSVPVQRLPTRADGPPPVPPPPRRPTIAAPVAEAEFTEVEPDAPPMAVVGTEPIADPVDDAFQPAQLTTPEVVIREASPPAYQPTASAGMSDLQRDLLARLRGDPIQRSAPVRPIGKGTKPQLGEKE